MTELQQQLSLLIAIIAVITALWKLFTLLRGIEDRLNKSILEIDHRLSELEHRSAMRNAELEHIDDKLELGINGTKELVQHVRSRTQTDCDRLSDRIRQIENYLTKTTDFQQRQ